MLHVWLEIPFAKGSALPKIRDRGSERGQNKEIDSMSTGFVADAMDMYYVAGEFAQCFECLIYIKPSEEMCSLCNNITFAQAEKYWTDQKAKFVQAEQDAIAEKGASSSGSKKLPEFERAKFSAWNITISVYKAFEAHILPLEGDPRWDKSVLGEDTMDAMKKFGPKYALSTAKTELLEKLMRKPADEDKIIEYLIEYLKNGKLP